jgi:hypothetical protein
VFLLFTVILLALPACSGTKDPREELVYGQTVRGQVTYDGKPVPYGFVLFYSHDKSKDPKAGIYTPSAVGPIVEGKYEITNAPLGHVVVCVATDPDVDLGMLTRPVAPGEKGAPGGIAGKGGFQPGMPPGGKFGMPPDGPPGIPQLPGGEQGIHKTPKLPPGVKLKVPGPPQTANLSDAQRKILKEIHETFGEYGKSPLAYTVKEGEQTYDIPLHKTR